MRRPTYLLAAALVVAAMPATADPVEDFYRGKQIRFIIRSGVGGSYDSYSRLLGRHIGKHIPGNPTIIAVNMPGGGGIRSANYVAKIAPQDGTKEPDAVKLYKQLETKHAPIPKSDEDRIKYQDLFQIELDTTEVKGINFLDPQYGFNLEPEIYKFLKLRLINKRDDAAFAWQDRSDSPEAK